MPDKEILRGQVVNFTLPDPNHNEKSDTDVQTTKISDETVSVEEQLENLRRQLEKLTS